MCQSRLSLNDFLYLKSHDSGREGSKESLALGYTWLHCFQQVKFLWIWTPIFLTVRATA